MMLRDVALAVCAGSLASAVTTMIEMVIKFGFSPFIALAAGVSSLWAFFYLLEVNR